MRIAQVAPLYESVPPRLYGGTERIVSYLTEQLVELGHEVTLFAAGDSRTAARLVRGAPRALRLDPRVVDSVAHHVAQLRTVCDRAGDFDVIHNHMDYIGFPVALTTSTPFVTTLHGRLDMPDLEPIFAAYRDLDLISISNDQRGPVPRARWRGTVYHGLPASLYAPGDGRGGYLAFLGRISPEKRVDSAIRVAEHTGVPLKIAAKIDRADVGYHESVIRPMLAASSLVEFIGEIGEKDKAAFLGGAKALLFPVDWPEPFGLVMIEAMACGTPIISRRRGSVPEVIDEGETGFICDDEASMIAAVERLDTIDRARCRAVFDSRFSARRMAEDYLAIYRALLEERSRRGAA
jgi:glycosyltransferase involved in cell wall biosynthesis